MKTKVWVLSTLFPMDNEVATPHVYAELGAAESEATRLIKDDWEYNAPTNDECEPDPWPDDWREASAAMVEASHGEYGEWKLTSHEIDVPIPQAFRDLVTLAAGLEEFESDYRFTAVLRACEAIVSGAGASSAPAEPDPLRMLQRLAEKTRRANSIQHSGGKLCPDDWAELHQLTNEAFGVLAEVNHG